MTISSTTVKNSYNGNGSTLIFNYTFRIFQDSDLEVIIRSADGTETIKTLNTHYTVEGEGSSTGGTVTFLKSLPDYDYTPLSTEKVIIRRKLPQTQSVDYIANDPFPAESHEEALDRAMMSLQEMQEELNRAIKLSKTNTINSTEFTKDATARANKVFGFDASGELTVATEIGTYKGNWSTGTSYVVRDIVKDTSNANIYICLTAHTSTGSQPISSNADVAKWGLIVDAASAGASATAAAASATAAATSATSASNSASSALTSETNAASSATSASTSASNASTSASNASTSASNAATSASNASTSATSASTSATSASTSASSASTSASTATTQAGIATAQADIATTQATNAASSAANALTYSTNASSSATSASTSAANASTYASNALDYKNDAQTAATNSANSYDAFDDRYLGSKSSDPTLDNDGNTLLDGALYWNTVDNRIKVYDLGNTTWKYTAPSSTEQTNINTVATNITNVNSVGSNITNVNSVVSNSTNIDTVASNITNVNNVGGSITNVNTVAGNLSGVNSFAERYRVQSSDPTTSLDQGDLVFNTSSLVLKYYNGTSWETVAGSGGSISDITSNDNSITITTSGSTRDLSVNVAASATSLTAQVRNETGATLTKGTIVYISGAAGNKALVSKAKADVEATSAGTFGFVNANISNNSNGYVTVRGSLSGINTSAYADGTTVYLSPSTAGAFTSTKPSAPDQLVVVGVITYSHATNGTIEITIQNGYELSELHDVGITSLANGNVLIYNSTSKLWENKAQSNLTAGAVTNGVYLTDAQTLTNKSISLGSNTITGTKAEFNAALSDGDFATLSGTETLTNKSIHLTNNTLTGSIAEFNTAVTDADLATIAGVETLTNKTLTTPIISSISNTGTLTLPTTTDTLVGRATTDTLTNKTLTTPVISSIVNTGTLTLPTSTDTLVGKATTDTLTNKSISLGSNTVTGTTAQFNTALTDGDFATLAGSETLTNKTLTSPVVNTSLTYANQGEVRFGELTANGSNYVGFKAPATLAADKVWTLPSTDGTSGQALVTNGSGTLSFANVGGGTFTATASGSITQGDLVALQTDGTVFSPSGTDYASLSSTTLQSYTGLASTALSDNVNSAIASNSTGSLLLQVAPNNAGNDIQVVAGTVSAGVVTWGTPLVIATNIQVDSACNVTFDTASGNFVIYYFGSGNTISIQAISVSGTTCTAGTAVTRASIDDDVRSLPAYYDSTAGKNVVLVHSSTTQYPSAIVVSVSGTTITLATTVVITSTASTTTYIWSDCFYNSTLNKGIFLYHNASRVVSLALGTISSGTISFGTSLSTGLTQASTTTGTMTDAVPLVTYDNDQSKVLMVYTASNSGTIYTYTVSGTTLTASTTYSFTSSNASLFGVYYLSAKKALVMMGVSGFAEVFYFNTTTGTYAKDTNFQTNFVAITPISPNGLELFGKLLYLNSGQRFAFYQVACSDGCSVRDMKTTLGIFDVPTTNLYIYGATANTLLLGLSNGTYANGDTANISYFSGGGIYTHSSSPFTFTSNYYKNYSNSFTASSTGTIKLVGTAITTGKLITSQSLI